MKNIDETYVIDQYRNGSSTLQIAKEFDTYPKKIERILKKNNEPIRSKSESQKLALKKGRSKIPTEGKVRTEEEKLAISEGREKAWTEMSDEDREKFKEGAKLRWDNIPADKKREMQEKAGRALRQACIEGSKQEKVIKNKLEELGYEVEVHNKSLLQGKFEIDLLLRELNTIIEVDGPQHFLPLFGQERLDEVIRLDSIKNGLLISKGFCVIRVKYLCRNMSKRIERELWDSVYNEVKKIEKAFPPEGKRLIELEINNE
jgi:very-short-patch-repair endonuclease